MIERILEFSLRQRAVIVLATAALLAVGIWSARELPIDAVPDITQPQVQINTQVPALAPEEAEVLVSWGGPPPLLRLLLEGEGEEPEPPPPPSAGGVGCTAEAMKARSWWIVIRHMRQWRHVPWSSCGG
jgi:hypothetical protein